MESRRAQGFVAAYAPWLGSRTHPVVVVVHVECLVRVDVDVVVVLRLLGGRPHEAPHRQLIDEELVPAGQDGGEYISRSCYY